MPLPTITMIGNLTTDPIIRWTQNGKPVTTLRVAANDRRKDANGEWVDGETCFVDITCWRSAEAVANSLKRGNKVVITGHLRQRDYESQSGEKRTAYDINADYVATMITDINGNPTPHAVTDTNPMTDDTPF